MKIEGGCLCGKVRYSADAEPAFVGVCHCKNCQKGSGTAFAIVVALPPPALNCGARSRRSPVAGTAAKQPTGGSVRCGAALLERPR